ncbi:hypothetical protein [Streptomyces platensis]|uniref:hypothetical protein n=1 Tax=Streptomyces platensis TaxID=58346 RepID=UPI0033166D95
MSETPHRTKYPTIVDWQGNERQWTPQEVTHHEARVARISGEVAEIRSAAQQMRDQSNPFHTEVADFPTAEALMLERANSATLLSRDDDTQERAGMFPTVARRALLIARAYTTSRQ